MNRVISVAAAALLAAAGAGFASPAGAQQAAPPPEVGVIEIQPGPVPLTLTNSGRVAALREVEVRARVSGILLERSFVEGSHVEEGDVLFRIDRAPYEAQVAHAKAQLQQAEAQLAKAERDHARAHTLFERGSGTQKARDDAISAVELGKAAVAAAEAQLQTAQINLGYTTVRAPISGFTSLRLVNEGALVGTGPDDSLLTRITELEAVYVHFSLSDSDADEIRRLMEEGRVVGRADGKLPVRLGFGDGSVYGQEGHVDFADTNIDLQTGTIRYRAYVPNAEMRLRPGQFVQVSVGGWTVQNGVVVPEAAVMQGPQGQFVYTIGDENKASARPIRLWRQVESGWLVSEGLEAGDRIVTEGVIKVRPGQPVTPAPAQQEAAHATGGSAGADAAR